MIILYTSIRIFYIKNKYVFYCDLNLNHYLEVNHSSKYVFNTPQMKVQMFQKNSNRTFFAVKYVQGIKLI